MHMETTILGFPENVVISGVPDEPEPEPPPTPASEVYPVKHGLTGNSRCGGERDMGTPMIAHGRRYGVRGPKDNPDPHISRFEFAQTWGGWIYSDDPDNRAHTAPWARDDSLGTDEVSARGNMWGDDIGDADGEVGIAGLAHLDGGETKVIDVQREAQLMHPARVIHTQGRVNGPLPLAAVERALVTQLASFRECYSADPASTSNNEGRIELDVTINTEGKITGQNVTQLAHATAKTAECMLDHVKSVTFAKADSESEITYPLLLVPRISNHASASGDIPNSEATTHVDLAPAIARTNAPIIPCGGTRRHPTQQGECKR